MNALCASDAHSSTFMCADFAQDRLVHPVHNCAMDIHWFKARKKALHVSDAQIGGAIGLERSVVNKVMNGRVAFDARYATKLADVFKVSPQELLMRAGVLQKVESEDTLTNATPIDFEGASTEQARPNLPVYGTALGTGRPIDGDAIEQTTLNKADILHYVKRPILLNRVLKAYALYIQGSSMHPALPDGEMVAVAPELPLSIGDNVVVYLRPTDPNDDDGETARAVLVKELVRRTSDYAILRQYQPPKDFRIEMADVVRIDRVLTRKEMMA